MPVKQRFNHSPTLLTEGKITFSGISQASLPHVAILKSDASLRCFAKSQAFDLSAQGLNSLDC